MFALCTLRAQSKSRLYTDTCCAAKYLTLQASGPYADGDAALSDILTPCTPDEFFAQAWEKAPLFISRPSLRQCYNDWLSEDSIFELLADDDLVVQYCYNLDVTAYDGQVNNNTHKQLSSLLLSLVVCCCAC